MSERGRWPNPFELDVVADPDEVAPADVAAIHRVPFERCCAVYDWVVQQHRSWSVLLYGEAGCGKTHHLSRLRRWLGGTLEPRPKVAPCLFVGVRMETGPGYVWRHVRRRLAEEITRRGSDSLTPLDQVLKSYAARAGGNLEDAFDQSPVPDMGLDLVRVLEHFLAGRHRRLCRAWLAGDVLTEADKQVLNIGSKPLEETEEDLSESDARRVVLALTRLCDPATVVFCFDQVEALGMSDQSRGYGAFSRMGASLVDKTMNSFVVLTVLLRFRRALEDASPTDYVRIAKESMDLQPLDGEAAKLLVRSRLNLLPELAGKEPIAESDLRAFLEAHHGRCTPRALIHEAKRLFDVWQKKPEVAPKPVPEFLRAQFDQLWLNSPAAVLPSETDAVLSHGLPLLLQLLGHPVQDRPSKHIDLGAEAGNSKLAIAYGNHADMRSYAAWLRRVAEQKTGSSVCLIRDVRLPVSSGAKAARERLDRLVEAGGKDIRIDAEAVAALDAMRRLLARATSGNLSLEGKTLSVQTVSEWLAANIPPGLTGFVEQLLGQRQRPPQADALLELLNHRKLVPLDEAVRLSHLQREEIEEYARSHPDQVQFLGGLCPVVCQTVTPGGYGGTH